MEKEHKVRESGCVYAIFSPLFPFCVRNDKTLLLCDERSSDPLSWSDDVSLSSCNSYKEVRAGAEVLYDTAVANALTGLAKPAAATLVAPFARR